MPSQHPIAGSVGADEIGGDPVVVGVPDDGHAELRITSNQVALRRSVADAVLKGAILDDYAHLIWHSRRSSQINANAVAVYGVGLGVRIGNVDTFFGIARHQVEGAQVPRPAKWTADLVIRRAAAQLDAASVRKNAIAHDDVARRVRNENAAAHVADDRRVPHGIAHRDI